MLYIVVPTGDLQKKSHLFLCLHGSYVDSDKYTDSGRRVVYVCIPILYILMATSEPGHSQDNSLCEQIHFRNRTE